MKTKLLFPLAALLLVTAGCGKKTTQKTTVGGVTVEQKGDVTSLEIKGQDGNPGMKVSASEKGVPLPANFPKDIPIFKDATVTMANTTGDIMQVQTKFKAPWTEALQFYADKLKAEGWKVENVMNMGETGMVAAKIGDRQCTVMFGKEDRLSYAMIMADVIGK